MFQGEAMARATEKRIERIERIALSPEPMEKSLGTSGMMVTPV
jgi:hypothetical protein